MEGEFDGLGVASAGKTEERETMYSEGKLRGIGKRERARAIMYVEGKSEGVRGIGKTGESERDNVRRGHV